MPTRYQREETGQAGVNAQISMNDLRASYRQQVQATVTPSFTSLLNQYFHAYPEMDAQAAVSLARLGAPVNDPAVQQAAQASVEKKKKSGGFFHIGDVLHIPAQAISDVASVVGKGLDAALGPVDERLAPAAKGALRTAFVVLEAPGQYLSEFARVQTYAAIKGLQRIQDDPLSGLLHAANPLNTVHDEALALAGPRAAGHHGSAAEQSIKDLIDGKGVDLGHGFLPGGDVEAEVKASSKYVQADWGGYRFGGDNLALTPGRAVAILVSEPGTKPFNIISGLTDAGIQWYGDPSAQIGAAFKEAEGATRIRRATNALIDDGVGAAKAELATSPIFKGVGEIGDETGRLPGVRNTVEPDKFDTWVNKAGRRVVDKIAATSDWNHLWDATKGQLGAELTSKLADATTSDEVSSILRDVAGHGLRDAPEFVGFKINKGTGKGVRLLATMPGQYIDPGDIDGAVDQIDRFMRNAKAPAEMRRAAREAVGRSTNRDQMYDAVTGAMSNLETHLVGEGIDPGRVRNRMTSLWNRDVDTARAYALDEIATGSDKAAQIIVNGKAKQTLTPFLMSEYLGSVIPLPEAREIRRATSALAPFVDTPLWSHAADALDSTMGLWKKTTLLRGAYTVRVIGEEQVRMAASDLDSLFHHPISYIAALAANPGSIRARLGAGQNLQSDILGERFLDEHFKGIGDEITDAMNQTFAGAVTDERYARDFRLFRPNDGPAYTRAWQQSIGELADDDVARKVAEGRGNLDSVKQWFATSDKGQQIRKRMLADDPSLKTRAGADRYIDRMWSIVDNRTQGDSALLDAIATGEHAGKPIGAIKRTPQGKFLRWDFSDQFKSHFDDLAGPETVKGQDLKTLGEGRIKKWDTAMGYMFSALMGKPTNYLSRNPTFRQRYWQRISEMAPFMPEDVRAAAIQAASKEGAASEKHLAALKHAVRNATTANATLDDFDTIAKKFALDQTKDLLYDVSERGQFFDVFRHIFPFGEAWKEILTRWSGLVSDNPAILRRGQQMVNGARGSGFFHKDQNGEEVFTYPGSQWFTRTATGVPFNFNGRVSGLSVLGDVLPGTGPLVQMSAAALLPNTPEWDQVRKMISPFGEQDYSKGILEAFAPGYAKNLMQFFHHGDQRLYANTAADVMNYLASTGDYDLSNEDEKKRLIKDANDKAGAIYVLRGLTQFVAPTSPMPEALVKVKNGKGGWQLDVAQQVADDFYKMQDKDYDSAVGKFLEKYGPNVALLLQGGTKSTRGASLPTTSESADWERSHSDLVKKYRNVWGLFAPKGDPDKFDYQAYQRQLERGDRVPLSADERIGLAQSKIGRWIYDQAKTKVGDSPSASERDWLSQVRDAIGKQFPGFANDIAGVPQGVAHQTVVAELTEAIGNPKLRDTPQAQATRAYLQARDRAIEAVKALGLSGRGDSPFDAKAATQWREWLAQVGAAISKKIPEFEEVFDQVFSREVD